VNIPPRKLDTTPNVNNNNNNNNNNSNSNNKRRQFIGNFLRPLFKCLLTPGNGSGNGSGGGSGNGSSSGDDDVVVSASLSCEKSSTTTFHTIDNGEEQSIKTNNTSYEMEDCEQPKYFSDPSCNNTSCSDKVIICASATPVISTTTAHVKNSPRKKPIKKKASKSSSRSNSKNDRAAVAYSVPSTGFSDMKGILPPQPAALAGRKTLVLDLDETLVHSKFDPVIGADFEIPIDLDGRKHIVYVLKRPHVDEFLREMGKHFEIVVFTASLSKYANPLLDKLDKHGVVAGRLFREHCTFVDHCYIKDLSRLGRDIDQSLIIDNSPACYAFQPLNAMPCSSWFGDQNDTQLLQMIPWLQRLAKEDTVYRALDEWRTYLNPQWY
jgi:Dullard-like phosphatase family protein